MPAKTRLKIKPQKNPDKNHLQQFWLGVSDDWFPTCNWDLTSPCGSRPWPLPPQRDHRIGFSWRDVNFPFMWDDSLLDWMLIIISQRWIRPISVLSVPLYHPFYQLCCSSCAVCREPFAALPGSEPSPWVFGRPARGGSKQARGYTTQEQTDQTNLFILEVLRIWIQAKCVWTNSLPWFGDLFTHVLWYWVITHGVDIHKLRYPKCA